MCPGFFDRSEIWGLAVAVSAKISRETELFAQPSNDQSSRPFLGRSGGCFILALEGVIRFVPKLFTSCLALPVQGRVLLSCAHGA